jgi:tRNA pseudouridine55 synthase
MSDAAGPAPLPPGGGLLIVDKPGGLTSHDVVARLRRRAGTRRVGHAGTLDPMATGVLVVAVDRSTRLLGHLALTEKQYLATIRLGQATTTDDAEGEPVPFQDGTAAEAAAPGGAVLALTDEVLDAALRASTGPLQQVPSAVSAVKVAGRRAYDRVRAGETVELAARSVTVTRFDRTAPTRRSALADGTAVLDVDVVIDCSTGTYVRALARDLGRALGTGGHLTALRRTRVGPFDLAAATSLADLLDASRPLPLLPAAAAVRVAFPVRTVAAEQVGDLRHGRPLPATGRPEVVAAFAPGPGAGDGGPDDGADAAGEFLALVQDRDDRARVVFGWQSAG